MITGCSKITVESTLEVELTAMDLGLKTSAKWKINIAIIFIDYIWAKHMLEQNSTEKYLEDKT